MSLGWGPIHHIHLRQLPQPPPGSMALLLRSGLLRINELMPMVGLLGPQSVQQIVLHEILICQTPSSSVS